MFSVRVFAVLGGLAALFVGFTNCSGISMETNSSSQAGLGNCTLAPSNLRSPKTIDETVDLINALPMPVTMDCFLLNLPKPMPVYAVDNAFSAQPSAGPTSPRIFILNGNLSWSVVPAGQGKNFLELGEFQSSTRSIKGEIQFPVTQPVSNATPYTRLLNGSGGTDCRICHQNETLATGSFRGEAYVSEVLKPESLKRVTAPTLKQYAINCDAANDAYRCAMLRAIFINGQAVDGEFP